MMHVICYCLTSTHYFLVGEKKESSLQIKNLSILITSLTEIPGYKPKWRSRQIQILK